MTETEEALAILRKARDRVQLGWCWRMSYSPDGRKCCPRAALIDAGKSSPFALDRAEREMLDEVYPFDSIAEWNDADGRTKDEVLQVFDAVINRLEGAA
jgi:hypothetical protein